MHPALKFCDTLKKSGTTRLAISGNQPGILVAKNKIQENHGKSAFPWLTLFYWAKWMASPSSTFAAFLRPKPKRLRVGRNIPGQTPLLWGVAEHQTTKRQGEIGPARTLNLSFRPCFSMEPSVYLMTLGTCDFRTWKMSRTHIFKPLEQAPVPRGGDMKCTWSNMQTTSKRPSICVESFAPWDWERCYKSLIAQFSQPQAHALFPYKALETLIAWWPIVALHVSGITIRPNSASEIWIKIWASLTAKALCTMSNCPFALNVGAM